MLYCYHVGSLPNRFTFNTVVINNNLIFSIYTLGPMAYTQSFNFKSTGLNFIIDLGGLGGGGDKVR